jgi:hypothetical protein
MVGMPLLRRPLLISRSIRPKKSAKPSSAPQIQSPKNGIVAGETIIA